MLAWELGAGMEEPWHGGEGGEGAARGRGRGVEGLPGASGRLSPCSGGLDGSCVRVGPLKTLEEKLCLLSPNVRSPRGSCCIAVYLFQGLV